MLHLMVKSAIVTANPLPHQDHHKLDHIAEQCQTSHCLIHARNRYFFRALLEEPHKEGCFTVKDVADVYKDSWAKGSEEGYSVGRESIIAFAVTGGEGDVGDISYACWASEPRSMRWSLRWIGCEDYERLLEAMGVWSFHDCLDTE